GQGDASLESIHQSILHSLHAPAAGRFAIIVSRQVQHSVYDIPDNLLGRCGPEQACLHRSLVWADEQFSVETFFAWVAVIEGYHVGGSLMRQPTLIQLGHGPRPDEPDGKFPVSQRQLIA